MTRAQDGSTHVPQTPQDRVPEAAWMTLIRSATIALPSSEVGPLHCELDTEDRSVRRKRGPR